VVDWLLASLSIALKKYSNINKTSKAMKEYVQTLQSLLKKYDIYTIIFLRTIIITISMNTYEAPAINQGFASIKTIT
jgi:hypothetical protein